MSTGWHASDMPSGPGQGARQTPTHGSETGQECVPNISPSERRKRLLAGVIIFVVSLAVLAALIASGAHRGWRLPLLLLFWGGASGFFQWRDKT